MLIVSQDGTATINFDNVEKIEMIYKEIIAFYKGTEHAGMNGTESIGFYKTEKRAKEVFEEIIKYNSIFEEIKALGGLDARRFIERQRYYKFDTYRMPKE